MSSAAAGVNDHGQGGASGAMAEQDLANAAASKRLGAKALDWAGPVIVLGLAFGIGINSITSTSAGGFITYDTSLLVLLGSIGIGLTLAYIVFQCIWESGTGKTVGNSILGLRTTEFEGYAPGGGPVFVRGVIMGAGAILGVIAVVLSIVFQWFSIVLWVVIGTAVIAAAWGILTAVSNAWDSNGKRQGWHDKAAKSLVFDVKAGRNPVNSGGIAGHYSFAPLDLPAVREVNSPVPMAQNQGAHNSGVQISGAQDSGVQSAARVIDAQQQSVHNPNQWQPPAFMPPAPPQTAQQPAAQQDFAPQGFQQQASPQPGFAPIAPAHPDDDLDRTRMKSAPAPVAGGVVYIRLDDGRELSLNGSALMGRNPASYDGETVDQLVAVPDPGRSISKTHLHLRVEANGLWVTDRNSTNGSGVQQADGSNIELTAGQPFFVVAGSTVTFGDRSFQLGQS
ncbi:RDD family protein [Pseudarthrobacter sp. J1738]|uniref:RDD family protein n=1 Tax=Pseudarthrobacter sp. J1738 TaxID=3420446 RepID=UPI003D2C3288